MQIYEQVFQALLNNTINNSLCQKSGTNMIIYKFDALAQFVCFCLWVQMNDCMISMSGNGALVAAKKDLLCEKPVVDAPIPKEVETSNTKIEKAKNEASHTPSSLRISSLTPCPGN